MSTKPLVITCHAHMSDAKLFTSIINQGIDSHLEAFTKSKFTTKDNRRLILEFDRSEVPILIRRLEELGTEEADTWVEDIKTYGREEI